jgi:hypothetical protein
MNENLQRNTYVNVTCFIGTPERKKENNFKNEKKSNHINIRAPCELGMDDDNDEDGNKDKDNNDDSWGRLAA